MRYIKCNNGHFYDADTNSSCPVCGCSNDTINQTVTTTVSSFDEGVTTPLNGGYTPTMPLKTVGETVPIPGLDTDEGVTVSFFQAEAGKKAPVVGWLVVKNGSHKGEDFRLTEGNNRIGRGSNMDVALTGENSVSRDKHAIIVYDPKHNTFYAQQGDAKGLFYLNGEVVLSTKELKRGDIVEVGEVEMMFIPCCDETFTWSNE